MIELTKDELERRAKIVADEHGGIFGYGEIFYIVSILYSASRSVAAFLRYDAYLDSNSEHSQIVSAVHEALGHAASLSRFLWPTVGNGRRSSQLVKMRKQRGKKLRDAFGLGDDSALKSRTLRNELEHFDEYLDRYSLEHTAGHFRPDALVGDLSVLCEPPNKVFKLVDPEASCFVLLGKQHYFAPIRSEVESVQNAAERMAQPPYRLKSPNPF